MEKSSHFDNLIELLLVAEHIFISPDDTRQNIIKKLTELKEIKKIPPKIWKINYYNNPGIFVRLYSAELKFILEKNLGIEYETNPEEESKIIKLIETEENYQENSFESNIKLRESEEIKTNENSSEISFIKNELINNSTNHIMKFNDNSLNEIVLKFITNFMAYMKNNEGFINYDFFRQCLLYVFYIFKDFGNNNFIIELLPVVINYNVILLDEFYLRRINIIVKY